MSTRLRALKGLLESVCTTEDIVKVHEARLTEKETTSLMPSEVEDYILTLQVCLYSFLFYIHYKKECFDDMMISL